MKEFSYLQNESIVKKEQALKVPFPGIFVTNIKGINHNLSFKNIASYNSNLLHRLLM
jgi:hypothetical protein